MKKAIATLSTAVIVISTLSTGVAATAAPAQAATDVSAYYRVDLGYMVTWKTPADKSGITGYEVTSSNGKTCVASGASNTTCTFTSLQVGYSGSYNFTVTSKKGSIAIGVSIPSNTVGAASIPGAPLAVTSEATSNTKIDIAWVPSTVTGNLSLYGYKLTYWKSDLVGNPIGASKVSKIIASTTASIDVSPKTMYIVDVAACNALGCNSANYWSYVATDPTSSEVLAVKLPTVISGGSASTTCFDSIYDANTGISSTGSCGSVIANPSTYPVIVPGATTLADPVLATKFANRAALSGFLSSYSLTTWATIGISWFANLTATSKSVTLGFTTTPYVSSTTPTVCEVAGSKIILKSIGTCGLSAYVDGNTVFNISNVATAKITVVK